MNAALAMASTFLALGALGDVEPRRRDNYPPPDPNRRGLDGESVPASVRRHYPEPQTSAEARARIAAAVEKRKRRQLRNIAAATLAIND